MPDNIIINKSLSTQEIIDEFFNMVITDKWKAEQVAELSSETINNILEELHSPMKLRVSGLVTQDKEFEAPKKENLFHSKTESYTDV